ncbi:MAG: hypothetical protein RLN78_01045 [Phycisphaerales bacterium]|jgi:hypothetical protein
MNTRTKAISSIILTAGFLSLTACSGTSNQHAGNVGSIRSNPTPAMHTLAQRSSDRANTHAYTFDTDLRSMNSDFDRMFHLNRPSRLHDNIKPY